MPDEDRQLTPTPEEETPWEVCESSNIGAIRRVNGVTQIRFKDKKTGVMTGEYHYSGIPDELHEKMRLADSIGSFFHQNIKGKPDYPAVKQEIAK